MMCIGCGCSEDNACFDDETGQGCHWAAETEDGPVCSVCVRVALATAAAPAELDDDAPLVQLATDAECDAMLRARRAGA